MVAILSYIARPCEREEGRRKGRKERLRAGVGEKIIDLEGQNISKGAE